MYAVNSKTPDPIMNKLEIEMKFAEISKNVETRKL